MEADLVVVIFWNRFGMQTQTDTTGTEGEVLRSLERCNHAGRPQVMMYFCQRPARLGREELEQRGKVLEFRGRVSSLALTVDYEEISDFEWRVRGKRGRGASGKTIVFGLLKRDGKVYTEIVPDCKKATLQAIIRGRVSIEAIIHSDGWRGYDGLVDVGYSKHFRVQHGAHEFARGTHHINGIESFWSYGKRRLQQFNGVPARTFYLHLKECEWRFNNRSKNLYQELSKLLRQYPL